MKSKLFLLLLAAFSLSFSSCYPYSSYRNDDYSFSSGGDSSISSSSAVPSFSVAQKDFYFVLTWGVQLDSSYDSRTGTLIKTKYVRERQPEEYITTYQYPNINEIYEMAKSINVYSYADDYYPYEGSLVYTAPSVDYIFEINDKIITSNDCPILNEIPDGVTERGKQYLTLILTIKNTLINSDEWKAMPDFEILYA